MDVREKLVDLLLQEDGVCEPSDCKYCGVKGSCGYYRTADRLIANGVTVQEWIPADDRLPDDNDRVIAFRPNEPEISAYKYCVMWGWSVKASLKHRGITHWMDIPQPPKGE